jgi:hypothetical protein
MAVAEMLPTDLNPSAAVAAAQNDQTLAAVAGKKNYVTGFEITGAGATAAGVIAVTLTGIAGGPQQYKVPIPAGATAGITPLIVQFANPLPASAENVAIVLTVPSFGAGNLHAAAALHGFRF